MDGQLTHGKIHCIQSWEYARVVQDEQPIVGRRR